MTMVQFEKTVQVLNWLARRNGGRIGRLRAMKLVFFADRYHLRKYGRMVTEDEYWAMRYGPVPSTTKEVAGMSFADGDSDEARYAAQFLAVESPNGKPQVVSREEVDSAALSETDVEALAFAWNTFGRRHDLVDEAHVYPEWAEHRAAIEGQGMARRRMDVERFLDDPPPGHNPCYPLTVEEREAARTLLRERQRILAVLGQE
jgi:hypothetical protein